MTTSVYRKVGLASLIMTVSVFLSRIIGLVREAVIAYYHGAGSAVDAYQIAFIIPEILNHIVASGFLSITFIPIYTRYMADGNEAEGQRVFQTILTLFGTLLILLIGIGWILAPQLVRLTAPGVQSPQTLALAVRMTRIIMPAQFFFFTGGLLMAIQFTRERFVLPALAPLLYNGGIIAGGILLSPSMGIEGFAWGVLAGALAGNFLIQYLGVRNLSVAIGLRWDWRHPALRKYVLLTLPLMVGLTMTFSTEFFLKFFGSFLSVGSIASLNYALRVMFALVGLFGQAVGMAAFPFMARLAADNNLEEMNRLLNGALRYLVLVIPFSILLMILRHEVVYILYQRGRFDAEAAAMTAQVLVFLLVGAFAFSMQTVVARGFYALQNTLLPAVFGTLAVLLSVPLYVVGVKKMGVGGVALAISFSAILQVALLYTIWNRRSRNRESRQVYRFLGKIVLLCLPLALLLAGCKILVLNVLPLQGLVGAVATCAVMALIFVGLLLGLGTVFKIEEIPRLLQRLKARALNRS
jgi:putative peptidoglycan lipid II flippase